jgi:hypothetical protein
MCVGFSVGQGRQGRPTFLKKCRPDRLGSASIPRKNRVVSLPYYTVEIRPIILCCMGTEEVNISSTHPTTLAGYIIPELIELRYLLSLLVII